MLPIGQGYQSNGAYPLTAPGSVLPLSVIGDVRPQIFYGRVRGMSQAMFPDRKPVTPIGFGELRASTG
jgi:hypothetical protein